MAKFEKELSELKKILVTGDNFDEIYGYFLDHLGENPDFLNSGKRAKHPVLKKVLEKISEELFREKVMINHLLLIKTKGHPFYHGACFMNSRPASIMFFSDIDMGMISISMSMITHEMRFIRFSTVQMKGGKEMFVHPSSKTIH